MALRSPFVSSGIYNIFPCSLARRYAAASRSLHVSRRRAVWLPPAGNPPVPQGAAGHHRALFRRPRVGGAGSVQGVEGQGDFQTPQGTHSISLWMEARHIAIGITFVCTQITCTPCLVTTRVKNAARCDCRLGKSSTTFVKSMVSKLGLENV